MSDVAALSKHLRYGEKLLWHVSESAERKKAWFMRWRLRALLMMLVCAALGVLAGYRFYQTIRELMASYELGAAIAAVLFFAFSAAMIIGAVLTGWGSMELGKEASTNVGRPLLYAITNQRVFSIDANGQLDEQIAAADIAEIKRGGESQRNAIIIKHADKSKKYSDIIIDRIDDPNGVYARLQKTFLELSK
jgi:hypothetical protein